MVGEVDSEERFVLPLPPPKGDVFSPRLLLNPPSEGERGRTIKANNNN